MPKGTEEKLKAPTQPHIPSSVEAQSHCRGFADGEEPPPSTLAPSTVPSSALGLHCFAAGKTLKMSLPLSRHRQGGVSFPGAPAESSVTKGHEPSKIGDKKEQGFLSRSQENGEHRSHLIWL